MEMMMVRKLGITRKLTSTGTPGGVGRGEIDEYKETSQVHKIIRS
jgi:hypothetical protein